MVSSDRMHGNGSKLHRGGLNFFIEKVVRHWNKLSREVIKVVRQLD